MKLSTDYSGVQSVTKVRSIAQPFMQPSKVEVSERAGVAFYDTATGKVESIFSLSASEVSY